MVTVSPSGPPGLFKGVTTAMSGVLARFPLLLPVRNSFASYGASAVTRTPDRGHVAEVKNQFHGVSGCQSGFPKKPFWLTLFGHALVCPSLRRRIWMAGSAACDTG